MPSACENYDRTPQSQQQMEFSSSQWRRWSYSRRHHQSIRAMVPGRVPRNHSQRPWGGTSEKYRQPHRNVQAWACYESPDIVDDITSTPTFVLTPYCSSLYARILNRQISRSFPFIHCWIIVSDVCLYHANRHSAVDCGQQTSPGHLRRAFPAN